MKKYIPAVIFAITFAAVAIIAVQDPMRPGSPVAAYYNVGR